MKKYECDGGSIMIGTKDSRVCLPNGYGDGRHFIKLVRTKKEKEEFVKKPNWRWVGSVNGDKFYVYSYDCLRGDELVDKENILYTLSGRYGVYVNNGNVVLEKWID